MSVAQNVNTPNMTPPPSKIPLYGSGHGMFFEPSTGMFTGDGAKIPLYGSGHGMFFESSTGMFTGDGAPRASPYRADGTLPSMPDRQTDFITKQEFPEPAEDQLHIQSKREVTKRMANFGKNGPIQTFRLGGPVPQGNQPWTRVTMKKVGEQSEPLGRRMPTAEDTEEERSLPRRPVYITDAMKAHHATLMGHETGEWEKERVKDNR